MSSSSQNSYLEILEVIIGYTTKPDPTSWVRSFKEEEQLETAILQRMVRLKSMCPEIVDKRKEKTTLGPSHKSPAQKELTELRKAHWNHDLRVGKLLEEKPSDHTVTELVKLRQQWDLRGYSLAWYRDRNKCAQLGGCCEQILGIYHRVLDDGIQKKTRVHGHCTVECSCCIEFRGCYLPDSRLPEPVVMPLCVDTDTSKMPMPHDTDTLKSEDPSPKHEECGEFHLL